MKRLFLTCIAIVLSILLTSSGIAENLTGEGISRSVTIKEMFDGQLQFASDGGEFDIYSNKPTQKVPGGLASTTVSLTITNQAENAATLSFDYTATGYKSFTINGSNGSGEGHYSLTLPAKGAFIITFQSKQDWNAATAILTMYNVSLEAASDTEHKHDYAEVVTPPSCIAGGYTTYTCSGCGDSYTANETAATGHDYAANVTAPTCTESGFTTHVCSNCGDRYVDGETPAKGHSYETVVTEPTCTTGGFTTYTCSVCKDSYTGDETPPGEHNYTSMVTVPTCTEGGYTTYTCAGCNNSYTDNETEALGHSYESKVTAPTCTTGGYTTYTCSVCKDSYTGDATPPGEHNYTSVVTAPTCTEGGYTTHTCMICGDNYTDTATEALGHSYESKVTAPTCTAEGYTTYTCSVCDDTFTSERKEPLGHDYVLTDSVEATCELPGVATYVCGNDKTHVDVREIPAKGHQYVPAVTEPTCTRMGYTTYTCACGDSYIADITDATGHLYREQVTAPTCTEDGYTTHTCSCGDSFTADVVQALGHDWDSGEITLMPSCEEKGMYVRACQRENCGETEKRELPPTGHTEEVIPAVEPDCTNDGWTQGLSCADCGKELVAPQRIPAAHAWKNTQTAGVKQCSACGEISIDPETCSEGLVNIGGAYYYIQADGTLARNVTMRVEKTNGLAASDVYTFGADGRMEFCGISGDADNNGRMDLQDAWLILAYDAGENVTINLAAADVNGNGKVNIHDALLIFQHEAGWDVKLQ